MGGVVDRERHFGPAQRGTVGGPGEDDVVHLAAAQRAGALGAEHPCDRVDDVRLPRPVRPHHDADAGLELERRLVGEGLEALQGQRLEKQAGPLSGPDGRGCARDEGGPGTPDPPSRTSWSVAEKNRPFATAPAAP